MVHLGRDTTTAIGRWSGLGPYYAMFPVDFAFNVINENSKPGDSILDPFAGRASSIYAAATQQRKAYGIEINPVGWIYGQVKLSPAPKKKVIERIKTVGEAASAVKKRELESLPKFFAACYSPETLHYLLAARNSLRWKTSNVDRTLMALILVCLHGKRHNSLSNQMRQGKAMSPEYSIRWWKKHKLRPPDIEPVEFLVKKAEWRYAKGIPPMVDAKVKLGDSVEVLRNLAKKVVKGDQQPFKLLFTSPPYHLLVNYHRDQWLRLWMLGGLGYPTRTAMMWKAHSETENAYRDLLHTVFQRCAKVMAKSAVIYVRTDARPFTLKTTKDALLAAFPDKELKIKRRPFKKSTQTALFGDSSQKPGEIDIILSPRKRTWV